MSDLLALGSATLETVRRAHMTQSVTVRRGATELTSVPATIGRTIFRIQNDDGLLEHVESRDYLIAAADLGVLGEPLAGDRIVEVLDGQAQRFEAVSYGGEPVFRYANPERTRVRIHTAFVGFDSEATSSATGSGT